VIGLVIDLQKMKILGSLVGGKLSTRHLNLLIFKSLDVLA
jgi:hypothetical protein